MSFVAGPLYNRMGVTQEAVSGAFIRIAAAERWARCSPSRRRREREDPERGLTDSGSRCGRAGRDRVGWSHRPRGDRGGVVDLEFSEDEAELRESVKDVLDGISPLSLVRSIYEGTGDDVELWTRMVELDWPALTIAEAHGGVGLRLPRAGHRRRAARAACRRPGPSSPRPRSSPPRCGSSATTARGSPLAAPGRRRRDHRHPGLRRGRPLGPGRGRAPRRRRDGDGWRSRAARTRCSTAPRSTRSSWSPAATEGLGAFVVARTDVDGRGPRRRSTPPCRSPTSSSTGWWCPPTGCWPRPGARRRGGAPGARRGHRRPRHGRRSAPAGGSSSGPWSTPRSASSTAGSSVRSRRSSTAWPTCTWPSSGPASLCWFAALTIAEDDPRRREAGVAGQGRGRRVPACCSSPTACSCTAASGTPGSTTCTSSSSGPRPATRCFGNATDHRAALARIARAGSSRRGGGGVKLTLRSTRSRRSARSSSPGSPTTGRPTRRWRPTPPARAAHVPDWCKAWIRRRMFDAGWLVPGWPPERGGRNAGPVETLVYMEELTKRRHPPHHQPPGPRHHRAVDPRLRHARADRAVRHAGAAR